MTTIQLEMLTPIEVPTRILSLQRLKAKNEIRDYLGSIHLTREYAEITDGHCLLRMNFDKHEQQTVSDVPERGALLRFLTGTPIKGVPYLEMQPIAPFHLVDAPRAAVAEVIGWRDAGVSFPDTDSIIQDARKQNYVGYAFDFKKMQTIMGAANITGPREKELRVGFPVGGERVQPFTAMRIEEKALEFFSATDGGKQIPKVEIVLMPLRLG